MKTTWRKLISYEMERCGESWSDVEIHTSTERRLDIEFDGGYGGPNGEQFTLWTKNRVYFPAVYDGLEWVASVSRNPDGIDTKHVGG